MDIKETPIEYQDSFALYKKLSKEGSRISLLLESRSLNLRYGKESVLVIDPIVKVTGKNEDFRIEALNENGKEYLSHLASSLKSFENISVSDSLISGTITNEKRADVEEEKRFETKNLSMLFRALHKSSPITHPYFGLYGAVAYDFARQYYSIGSRFNTEEGEDFIFFLPSQVYVFDDITKSAKHITFYPSTPSKGFSFSENNESFTVDVSDEDYLAKAQEVIADIKNGRAMQCVYSREVRYPLKKHPLTSYEDLRESNPSPYSFYFTLGNNEVLYGASPELHIKIQQDEIEIRPIAGTVRRSTNPLEDAKARIHLLTDEKEKREHTMLVDLARNELYALCERDSVHVSDLFTIEHYPNLYHLVSGVKGKLRKNRDLFDALLVTLPAGTLSGAPKQEAMRMIEKYENSRRGFYGGIIGYFSFDGSCNTGITIRSVHVKNGFSKIRAGGGVVALSSAEGELAESKLKMTKMLHVAGAEHEDSLY